MIELVLTRDGDTGTSCYGRLAVGGAFQCYTLEDSTSKGYGKGCGIPPGKYRVTWEMSPRLKKRTLRLHGVPNREGILIHAGNTVADCIGCILVGKLRIDKATIAMSRDAVKALETLIVPRLSIGEPCTLTVR